MSTIFNEVSYFVIVVVLLFLVVSWISDCNVQIYGPGIGFICGVKCLLKVSGVGLCKMLLALSLRCLFQCW